MCACCPRTAGRWIRKASVPLHFSLPHALRLQLRFTFFPKRSQERRGQKGETRTRTHMPLHSLQLKSTSNRIKQTEHVSNPSFFFFLQSVVVCVRVWVSPAGERKMTQKITSWRRRNATARFSLASTGARWHEPHSTPLTADCRYLCEKERKERKNYETSCDHLWHACVCEGGKENETTTTTIIYINKQTHTNEPSHITFTHSESLKDRRKVNTKANEQRKKEREKCTGGWAGKS